MNISVARQRHSTLGHWIDLKIKLIYDGTNR